MQQVVEYMVVDFRKNGLPKETSPELEEALDAKAKMGWRLVHVIPVEYSLRVTELTLIFERYTHGD